MRRLYILALFALLGLPCFGQAPLLLAARHLGQELNSQVNLGWRHLFLLSPAYQPIDDNWLTGSFLPSFRDTVRRLGLRSGAEGWDCDNFAQLFRSELAVESYLSGRAGVGEAACAMMIVEQERSFGAVRGRAGLLHSLIIVRTSAGWRVIEPQTLRISDLSTYPNRTTIRGVYF